jgi:hypothetical protein
MKASPSSISFPSAATSRHPDDDAVAAAGGMVTGRMASHMAALGLPFVFMAVASSMDAIPPTVPPPCASLKASPLFHELKSSSWANDGIVVWRCADLRFRLRAWA